MSLTNYKNKQVYHFVDRPINVNNIVSAQWPICYTFQFVQPQENEDKSPGNILQILKLKPVNKLVNPTHNTNDIERPTIANLNQIGLGAQETEIIDFDDDKNESFDEDNINNIDEHNINNIAANVNSDNISNDILFSPMSVTNEKNENPKVKQTKKKLKRGICETSKKTGKKPTSYFPILEI